MNTFSRVATAFVLGVALQGGVYFYLDHYYLAPTSDFTVSGTSDDGDTSAFDSIKGEGQRYYSYDKTYMALVTKTSVNIYTAGSDKPIQIDLKGREVSYFEWMPDRYIAIMGLYGGDSDDVVLARVDPQNPDHEADTTISDLPEGSEIDDVAYSTATNVVYMKIKVGDDKYRIYRTDANYDTRRVYMQASDIGRIAVFYDKDLFFYDNARTNDVFMFNGEEGGWRVINPPGAYRLVGVDKDQNIYIAKMNDDEKVVSVSRGKLGVGFKVVETFDTPTDLSEVTVASVEKSMKDNGNSNDSDK